MTANPLCTNCNTSLVPDLSTGGHGMSECTNCKAQFCYKCGLKMGHTRCPYCNNYKGFCKHPYIYTDYSLSKCKYCKTYLL